jgi:predicted lactoylglutathione lyase
MIGYITLGTNDIEKGARFYDELLGEIGAKRSMESETFIAWSVAPDTPGIAIIKPNDGNPATVGNGVMVGLAMESTDQVDRLYNKAIELGAADEGAAGPRGDGGFYGGYFRDMDGNKLNFFCMSQ